MDKTIHWFEHWVKKNANNESDKDFFKLTNDSVFGKTMKNGRN